MRLRFTIRDLLWLALVVALAVGWWIDRSRLNATNEQLRGLPMMTLQEMEEMNPQQFQEAVNARLGFPNHVAPPKH